ncbi:hypothetical protein FA15DRAFT_650709 [Coprinopsis marcescibilis]|uniref:Cleavage/polyadenylation specificity factor A subunit C-terminal domain-containing protein n=1 Tax=Coprinopsis marcescibilis TaxID=230819 RepID=A0A5C3KB83_COPMA|nr:hypothetical protein FA15DRAFT_650709 [Coprinopsis marcescibilis]
MLLLRQDILPPSGVEFATHLRLTPSCVEGFDGSNAPSTSPTQATATAAAGADLSTRHAFVSRVICNLVVARSNLLRIFEVREEAAPIVAGVEEERERRAQVRRGTEALEGELMMDSHGDGFISVGGNMTATRPTDRIPTITRLYLLRSHLLHGTITGLEAVSLPSTREDKLERLAVSFKDAKVALLEWSDAAHDLVPVSIHTYERAPQLLAPAAPLFVPALRVEPNSRCVGLSLPNHSVAILPFVVGGAELGVEEEEGYMDEDGEDIPYNPSFILDLAQQVDTAIRNVIDFVFLPGFNSPTMAVLFQTVQTWTGRLKEHKDTTRLVIFTLDLSTSSTSTSSSVNNGGGASALGNMYPVISSVENLPSDALGLVPCTKAFPGGVVVLTSNGVVFVDGMSSGGSGRRVGCAMSGWAGRVSEVFDGAAVASTSDQVLSLEGARGVFISDKTLLVVLKDGSMHKVEVEADGRNVKALVWGVGGVGRVAGACVVRRIDDAGCWVFVGSTVGPSVLLRVGYEEEVLEGEEEKVEEDYDMDLYVDDDDLYGDSSKVVSKSDVMSSVRVGDGAGGGAGKKYRTVVKLSLGDALDEYGPITDLTFSLAGDGDRTVPELVATTGSGLVGGFTLFQRDLPVRTKKKLLALGGSRGLWSLPVRLGGKVGGAVRGVEGMWDTVVLSTDATPSPGLSRIATRVVGGGAGHRDGYRDLYRDSSQREREQRERESGGKDLVITTRVSGTSVGAAPFFQKTAVLVVMTNAIKVLEPDGTERQTIQDMDGKLLRPKIRACSINDPFVLIVREDDSLGLFIGETERGKIRRKDMSPMGDKASRYLAGCFFTDTTGLFAKQFRQASGGGLEGAVGSSTLQSVINPGGSMTQWLLLVRPQGVMEIWTLPKLTLAFSSEGLNTVDNVLVDSGSGPGVSPPIDTPRKPQDFDVESILVAPIGEDRPGLHLCVFLRSGQLTIYEALSLGSQMTELPPPTASPPSPTTASSVSQKRTSYLDVKFVKVQSMAFVIQRSDGEQDPGSSSILAEQKRINRAFVPFETQPAGSSSVYSGVFFTGDRPNWIFGTNHGGVKIYPSGHAVVNAFTPCSLWESRGDFLLYTEEGPRLLEWLPDFSYDGPLPARSVPRGRSYSNVLFDPSTCLIVAASSLQAKFASYDEDGNRVWEPDAPNVSDPLTDTSALELISPNSWVTMDGFEFATNEFINDISIVTLETAATETGTKDFIAVGTTIDRGEDLAAKGAAYIFEIVEVVPDPEIAPTRWYKLRLRCRDDAKGPVTAVCGFHGYLVSSMGQKIFVRAFDSDERLVGVAFLDVGIYVTSLRVLKNLLLIGDAVKSIMFVAFQEDPYKLILLAKDPSHHCVTRADFFFADGQMALVAGDEEGIMRVYEYNPHDPESRDGRHLLLRTEFHGQVEYRTSVTIARRDKEDPSIPQSKLLIGSTDGSLSSLTPVDEHAFKRLQLLQGQLTRNIQHAAGLNPKAFRIVKNDYVSRPLSKGVLDGTLLAHYETLPIPRQNEMTKQIGTERWTVLKDWIALTGPW